MSLPGIQRTLSPSSSPDNSSETTECPDKPLLLRSNSSPARLGSAITRALKRVSRKKSVPQSEPFYGNKAAEICYKFIVDTYECDDESKLSATFSQPPLPQFVFHVLLFTLAPNDVISTTILFLYRYYVVVADIEGLSISGHLIFAMAFMTAAKVHLPEGCAPFTSQFWAEATGYSAKDIPGFQKMFLKKLDWDLGPISISEEKVLQLKSVMQSFSSLEDSDQSSEIWPPWASSTPHPELELEDSDSDEDHCWSLEFSDEEMDERLPVLYKTPRSERYRTRT
ncbi:hypothetical protein BDZ97DRAFT_1757848 [Flammula alnicola]|nr:hypothetical protein BDZ97DRAFT_1757848 [Flammula alnicola]